MKATIKIKKTKFQIYDYFIIIALSLLQISFMSINSDIISKVVDNIRIVVFVFLIASLVFAVRRMPIRYEMLLYYAVTIILSFRSGFFNLLIMMVLVMIFWKKNYNDMFKIFFVVQTINLLFFFLIYHAGIIVNYEYVLSGRARNTLGFSNVNYAAFFFISWLVVWLVWKKMKTANVIVASIIAAVVFYITDTRTAIIFYVLFIGCYYLIQRFFKKGLNDKKLIIFIDLLIVVFTVFPFLSNFLFQRFPWIDYILSGRLSIVANLIRSFNISVFLLGTGSAEKGLYISESFVINMIFYFGVIFLAWTVFIILRGVNKAVKRHDAVLTAFFISLWIANFAESYLPRLDNMTSIMFWVLIYMETFKKEERQDDKLFNAFSKERIYD